MPQFEDLDVDPEDDAEKLAAFKRYSRQVLLMALFENDSLGFSVFSQTAGEPFEESPDASPESQKTLRDFSHYLFSQMVNEFPAPDELTLDEWLELAHEMTKAEPSPPPELPALAKKIYQLLRQELRLQIERQIRQKSW